LESRKRIYDLIYEGETPEDFKFITEAFPAAVLHKDRDDIHGYRTSVDIKGVATKEYFKVILLNGFGESSFMIQMALRDVSNHQTHDVLVQALNELDPKPKKEDETDSGANERPL
jgi:hypothetical protein